MNSFIRFRFFCLLLAAITLSGCVADSVVFHERTQFGLNVEARPELNTPVSLNMAYNRNLVAVVPSKNEEDAKNNNSDDEAVSLLSTFGMDYKQGQILLIGSEVFIHNHFATGKAAELLTKPVPNGGSNSETAEAIKSFVGGNE